MMGKALQASYPIPVTGLVLLKRHLFLLEKEMVENETCLMLLI